MTRNAPRSKDFTTVIALFLVLLVSVIVKMRSTTKVSLDTVFSQFWQTSSVALEALALFWCCGLSKGEPRDQTVDLPAGARRQAVNASVLWRRVPGWGCGQDPSVHAEISADNQALRGLTLLVWCLSGKRSVQYKVASPGAGDGGSRKSSVSQLWLLPLSCPLKR